MGSALEAIAAWPATTVAAGWRQGDGATTSAGPTSAPFPLASVTKPLFALAVLVAVEEGSVDLEMPAGPPGSTVAHLLSHSSGLAPEATGPITAGGPGTKRIYSNHGFEVLGQLIEQTTGIPAPIYLAEGVLQPLGMANTALTGSPAHGATSTVEDLLIFGRELLRPTLITPPTLARATSPYLPALDGVLPGFGRQQPNPWGLGFEIRGSKKPHWTGTTNSAQTFGHFGRSGTFIWVDPEVDGCCVVLTDEPFGPWAAQAWPPLSDRIRAEMSTSTVASPVKPA